MAPTSKSKPNAKSKPIKQRKSSRRKSNAPPASQNDKENVPPPAKEEIPSQLKTHDELLEKWWKMNGRKDKLIDRFMKECKWDFTETERIFNAYSQFLLIKKEYEYWDGTLFVPCWPVNKMWKQHNQVRNHVAVYFDSVEYEQLSRLEKATNEALVKCFGSYDKELWDDRRFHIITHSDLYESTYEYNLREPLSDVFESFAEDEEEDINDIRFVFNGQTLRAKEDHTLLQLGIEHGSIIQAYNVNKVAVTICYSPDKRMRYHSLGQE